jgi:predicted ATPase/DNA-binding SARP family transcriptional activator
MIQQRDMSDSLEIYTLGKLEIRRNGMTLTDFPTRKVEALLVYLACTGGPHGREQVAELLWDDRTQAQSLTNLRATLSRLNERLAPFLLVTRKTVAIHPEAQVWIDAVELHTALQADKSPLSSSVARQLERVLALYKGDFLTGFYINESQGFEEWLRTERERLRIGVMEALSHLASFHLARASFDAGVAYATRLLSLDPLREDAHRLMMMLLASKGQRSSALSQYDLCRQILADELGAEPEAATTALSRQIRSGTFVVPVASPNPLNNLPVQPTRFIGRQAELSQLEEYLDNPDCRLLTLIGPGGVGKTRLAYQVAAGKALDFPAGVCAIPLSGVASPEYVVPTMAECLQMHFYSNDEQKQQLIDYLRTKHLLLVLDNCEHVLNGMGLLAEIISVAPGVKILATSRERLNLQGEWVFPVDGLSFPQSESGVQAEASPAVQLFVQSARHGRPNFSLDDVPAVSRICQLVEGLPLALELAASWVHHMPCERIAAHIQHDLDFLSTNLRDVPERHRSTRTLFEHSWCLLTEEEQATLRKLSVFRGGFDADAAAHVASASLYQLSALTEKSLVRSSPAGRYDLHELLRQFAEEKLRKADEEVTARDRHLDYLVTWAEEATLGLCGASQVMWFQRIETEQDNLRAALSWGINGQRPEIGLRLANALWWFWFRRGYWHEGYEWLRGGLAQTEGETPTRASALYHVASLIAQLHPDGATSSLEEIREALRISQKVGPPAIVAMSYVALSFSEPDYSRASELFEQALSLLREANAHSELTGALFFYGYRVCMQGDLNRAEALYQESLEIAQADQNYGLMLNPLGNLGRLAIYRGDYERAAMLLQRTVAIGRELGNRVEIADWLVRLGTLELYRGNYSVAGESLEEALALFRDSGNRMGIAHASHCLADLALHQSQYARAATLVCESLSLSMSLLSNVVNREWSVSRLLIVGQLARRRQDYEAATRLLGGIEALRGQGGYLLEPLPQAEYEEAVADVRLQLEPEAFSTAWAAGLTMTEAGAITSALSYLHAHFNTREGA